MLGKLGEKVLMGIGVVGLAGVAAGLIVAAPFILLVMGYMFLWMAVIVGPFLLWEKLKEQDNA